MLKFYPLLIFCFLFFIILNAKAQYKDTSKNSPSLHPVSNSDTVKNKKSSLKIGVTYDNNTVFLGRTDSIATPSFNTGITYTLKSGIFFSGSVNYVPSRQFDKLDGGSLETGYNFDSDNLSGGIALSKYFASFNSTQIISALDATLGAELSYNLWDIVTPSVHADYALVSSDSGHDFILTGGITHEFSIEKPFSTHDQMSISPAIHFNSGSQNFYNSYYSRKQKSAQGRQNFSLKKGKGAIKISNSLTAGTPVTTTSNKFQLLDYEFSMPLGYTIKKLAFEFSPVYAIAVHKIDDDGTKTFYIPNSSVFYFQAAIAYTF